MTAFRFSIIGTMVPNHAIYYQTRLVIELQLLTCNPARSWGALVFDCKISPSFFAIHSVARFTVSSGSTTNIWFRSRCKYSQASVESIRFMQLFTSNSDRKKILEFMTLRYFLVKLFSSSFSNFLVIVTSIDCGCFELFSLIKVSKPLMQCFYIAVSGGVINCPQA